MVGSGELRVDPDKVSAVADWAAPRDIKGVSNSSDLLTITTISYVILHVLLHLLVTFCQTSRSLCGGRNSSWLSIS